jgi:putative FmdB family regulatory protein
MPIYAYACSACGHAEDVMQKMSEAPLTLCPKCGASSFAKQITAAGFALKGSGWYATDFKGTSKPAEKKNETPAPACGSGGCGACS